MEYIVSAENTPYYHWQLELLIESFRHHNLQDKLHVALAQDDAPTYLNYHRNAFTHPKIFPHENIGRKRGYAALNGLYSTFWSVKFDRITQPFVSVPPDVVMRFPMKSVFKPNVREVLFVPDPFFTFEAVAEAVGPFWEWLGKTKDSIEQKWTPVGPVMGFNQIPVEIFERTIVIAETLAVNQLLSDKPIWPHTDKLAWAVNLSDYFGSILLTGDYTLVMNMLNDGEAPFIHYEHGLPPVFNKAMFKPPISFGDPFQILSENSPTANSHFMSLLAGANLRARVPVE